jgi:hypothetical protein
VFEKLFYASLGLLVYASLGYLWSWEFLGIPDI